MTSRSSHQRCSIEIGILKNFAKFTEKHLCTAVDLKPGFCVLIIKL